MTLWMFWIPIFFFLKRKRKLINRREFFGDTRSVVRWFSEVQFHVTRLKMHCLKTPMEKVQTNAQYFVEKEMLLVTKFVFEPWWNPTLLRSLCPKV